MINRRCLLASASLALCFPLPVLAQDKLRVTASFSVLGDMVAQIGGDRIDLTVLVGPDADAHMFQPAPADARAISDAGLVVMNGLGFEGWMPRLIEAAGYKGPMIEAAADIDPIASGDDHKDHAQHSDAHDDHKHEGHKHDEHKHDEHKHAEHKHDDHKHDDHAHDDHKAGAHEHDHGAFDPHAWQDVRNAMAYARTIAAGLELADPGGAETYRANLATWLAELEALDAEIRALVDTIPADRRRVVTAHASFEYFARSYGIEFLSIQGMSTESEASARDVANLIRQIKDQNISAIFVENVSDDRLLQQVTAETGAVIGGTLFSDALSMLVGPAPSYTAMMRHNAQQLVAALALQN